MTAERKISINEKLDIILQNQKKILKNEKRIIGEEKKIEKFETKELKEENIAIKDDKEILDELNKLEKQIKKASSNPIKNITKRDIIKGFIGAFIGVMSHFAFSKAADIALTLSFLRATVLYLVAFIIIIVMLYYSGFRSVEKSIVLKVMPIRAIVLYTVSILTIVFVYLLFGKLHFVSFKEIYILVSASIILAVMGAGTADLIGRSEE